MPGPQPQSLESVPEGHAMRNCVVEAPTDSMVATGLTPSAPTIVRRILEFGSAGQLTTWEEEGDDVLGTGRAGKKRKDGD